MRLVDTLKVDAQLTTRQSHFGAVRENQNHTPTGKRRRSLEIIEYFLFSYLQTKMHLLIFTH